LLACVYGYVVPVCEQSASVITHTLKLNALAKRVDEKYRVGYVSILLTQCNPIESNPIQSGCLQLTSNPINNPTIRWY